MSQRTEVWYCLACGVRSERPVTRGGKPHWCKDCAANTRFRTCAECGGVKPMTGYICGDCNQVRRQERNKGKQLLLTVRQPKRSPYPTEVQGRRWVAGPCSWCGTPFVIIDQLEARFCSRRCSGNYHKVKRGRFQIPPAIRLSIYERDGWICQLCTRPVERDGDPYGDWAPSLDHIECQSWALIPDHSSANLRLAHRWCNAARGDETGERVNLASI